MNKKEYNFKNAKQGSITGNYGKTRITIRLDTDVLNYFRNQVHVAGGGNYQTLINEALRKYIQDRDGTLEHTLRMIIKEELKILSD